MKSILSRVSTPADGLWLSVAAATLAAMTVAWLATAVGFLAGFRATRWETLAGVVAALLALGSLQRTWAGRLLAAGCSIALLLGCLWIASITVDDSFDGWLYHQSGVIGISQGWNPVSQPDFGEWWARGGKVLGYPSDAPALGRLWTTVYPKAPWTMAAQPLLWGLSLDSGKFPAMLLIFIAGAVAFRALRLRSVPARPAVVLAVLVALNPIAVMQATSFYVDGLLGSCLSILAFALICYDSTRRMLDLFFVLCAALIACDVKFTGPLYVSVIALPVMAYWLWRSALAPRHLLLAGVAIVVLLGASVNPYLTNVRLGGSPVYPLNQTDVMEDQMSSRFLQKNRFEKFVIALTYSNLADHFSPNPAWHEDAFTSPLQSRSLRELRNFGSRVDLHFGGFGPVFALVLTFALLAAVLQLRHRRSADAALYLVTIGVAVLVLANPEMWWARYVPQLWILPVLVAARVAQTPLARQLAVAATVLMGATSLLAVAGRAASAVTVTTMYRQGIRELGHGRLLVDLSQSEVFFLPPLTYRLYERGASFRLSSIACSHPIDLRVVRGCRQEQ